MTHFYLKNLDKIISITFILVVLSAELFQTVKNDLKPILERIKDKG